MKNYKDLEQGCICELDEGQKPDHCVIDSREIAYCILAVELTTKYKGESNIKKRCKYWKPEEKA